MPAQLHRNDKHPNICHSVSTCHHFQEGLSALLSVCPLADFAPHTIYPWAGVPYCTHNKWQVRIIGQNPEIEWVGWLIFLPLWFWKKKVIYSCGISMLIYMIEINLNQCRWLQCVNMGNVEEKREALLPFMKMYLGWRLIQLAHNDGFWLDLSPRSVAVQAFSLTP